MWAHLPPNYANFMHNVGAESLRGALTEFHEPH